MAETRDAESGEGGAPARARPIVLCATAFERSHLISVVADADICCTGPGPEGIVGWAERNQPDKRIVILAGLAGSLRESIPAGAAHIASAVIAADGRHYRSAFDVRAEPGRPQVRAVVATSTRVLASPKEKRAFAEKTGADLVDLESGYFAEAASVLGWRWVVVKGVSDGLNETLPPGIGEWLNERGEVRAGRVVKSMLPRPWAAGGLLRLRSQASRAMESVCGIIRAMLEAPEADARG